MAMQWLSKASLSKNAPKIAFPAGIRLDQHLREIGEGQRGRSSYRIYEFVGTDSFAPEFYRRQRYEVDAGRDEEPILYLPLYDEVRDANLPKHVDVFRAGPGGVIFEEVLEGGEVKFSTVEQSEFTVPIRHWGTGLEYSKDVVKFNQTWNLAIVERAVGIAHNALLNHLHLNPILAYAYAAANQTAASAVGGNLTEKYLSTLQDAVTNSRTDGTNPRRGPYALLISSSNAFMVERALTRVPQQGTTVQPNSLLDLIRSVIVYDGWTGNRGLESVTYSGVTANKAYLISQQYRGRAFRSFVSQDLQNEGTERDLSRFMTQTVWDSYWGVYANPIEAVEEVTLPTS